MGLDITACENIKPLDCVYNADGEPLDLQTHQPIEDCAHLSSNPYFLTQADGLEDGYYSHNGNAIGFRAGSYGGYNSWRNELAKLAGYAPSGTESGYTSGAWRLTSGPFWEQINFSDCEGVIGATTSAKLAKDYTDHQEAANAHSDKRFIDLYNDWRSAFELASNGGCVCFH